MQDQQNVKKKNSKGAVLLCPPHGFPSERDSQTTLAVGQGTRKHTVEVVTRHVSGGVIFLSLSLAQLL